MNIRACDRIISSVMTSSNQSMRLTFVTLWTDPEASKLFAFSFPSEVKGMSKLARIALFAQSSLIMLADEVTDARTFIRRSVVPIRTCWTAGTMSSSKVFAYWTIEFSRESKVVCVLKER